MDNQLTYIGIIRESRSDENRTPIVPEHIQNIKENNPKGLNCDITKGSIVAVNAHMGNIAYKTGEKIYWDKLENKFF